MFSTLPIVLPPQQKKLNEIVEKEARERRKPGREKNVMQSSFYAGPDIVVLGQKNWGNIDTFHGFGDAN